VFQELGGTEDLPRDLLLKIAGSVQKASLEPVLLSLNGAELRGDVVTLDPGTVNEFFRRQIRENLPLVAHAATAVVGRPVRVQLGQELPQAAADAPAANTPVSGSRDEALLERLQREPVIRSFLDVFPGPVKAEKIDE
jgi:hypothetical protein